MHLARRAYAKIGLSHEVNATVAVDYESLRRIRGVRGDDNPSRLETRGDTRHGAPGTDESRMLGN